VVGEGQLLGKTQKEVVKAEEALKRRVAVGNSATTESVRHHLRNLGISEFAINRCMELGQRRGLLFLSQNGKFVQRVMP
jgi:hypothetical protein